MNTRRLPTRAAAKEKAEQPTDPDNTTDEKMKGVTFPVTTNAPPVKRQRRVSEKNDFETNDAIQNEVNCRTVQKTNISAEDPAEVKVRKNDDDQTATTCTETPASDEKSGKASNVHQVSGVDFYPMHLSSDGAHSFQPGLPPPHVNVYGYPTYPPLGTAPPPPLTSYSYATVHVPPTVHMPFPVSHISPLQAQQSLKKVASGSNEPKKIDPPSSTPATPRHASIKESEAALAMLGCATEGSSSNAKSSPLDLLSSVSSSSPTAKAKKTARDATFPPVRDGSAPPPPYKYPPPPEQMDVCNFHFFPQVPHQAGPTYGQADEYPLVPPILDSFGPDDDFNPDTPSSRHSSIGDVLNAANVVERTESTIKSTRKKYADQFSDQSPRRRRSPNTKGSDLFSARNYYPPGMIPTNLPSVSGSAIKMVHSIAPEVTDQAEKACLLAKQALENPYIGKQLLLSMAIVRTNPRSPPSSYPAHGTVLTDRFHWASFPPLDSILRKNMERYYELSTQKCQSKDQQDFNNALVDQVKAEAYKYGWEFDRLAFDDKKIRDRIRCFFKTHIQNAKKRLKTMLRNPNKKANIKALAEHFYLIEEKYKVQPPVRKHNDFDESEGYETKGVQIHASNDESTKYVDEKSDDAQLSAYSEI